MNISKNENLNGKEIDTAASDTAANTPLAQAPVQNYAAPKPLTKKQKLRLIIGCSIAACFLVLYLVGSSLTSKERAVENFKKAMTGKNAKKVASMLVSSDKRLTIDEKGVKPLFAYMDKNPSSLNNVLNSLDNSNSVISVKKQGKKFLFFDNYVFEIKPVFFNVNTNYKDTKIFVDDKEIVTADKEDFSAEVGPFIPGLHNIKAVLKGDYVDLQKASEVTAFDSFGDNNQLPVDLSIEASTLEINTSFIDSKIFINGKDTGLTTSEAKKLGPVAINTGLKLYIQKDLPFGTCKSEEIEIKDSYIELNLQASEDVKTSVSNSISQYFTSEVQAYNALDISKLKFTTEVQKSLISSDIENFKSENKIYSGKLEKIELDMDSLKLSDESVEMSPNYVVVVGAKLYYDDAAYYKGDTGIASQKHEQDVEITLCYNVAAKVWQVNNNNYYYSFDSNSKNKKELALPKQ